MGRYVVLILSRLKHAAKALLGRPLAIRVHLVVLEQQFLWIRPLQPEPVCVVVSVVIRPLGRVTILEVTVSVVDPLLLRIRRTRQMQLPDEPAMVACTRQHIRQ